jgi:glucokinase
MSKQAVLGVDLGATNIRVGVVQKDRVIKHHSRAISSTSDEETVLKEIVQAIDSAFNANIQGIGFGVPSLVDVDKGIVYDVENIPSWKKVHLKDSLEHKYHVPVFVNNDANCFALGESHFGKGKKYQNMVGLTIGTGLGAGIIIDRKLYSGFNCGAGEFGSIPYKDRTYEGYCSGQFFTRQCGLRGEQLSKKAANGDQTSLEMFEQFGTHLGNAIKTVLFAVDPEAILLGGSISEAFPFFRQAMWKSIESFQYKHTVRRLMIDRTEQPQIALLGAAALFYDAQEVHPQ